MFLLLLLGSECLATPQGFPTTAPVRFIAMGDSGTGGEGQYRVAAALKQVCAERGCQFAVNAGDNIYESGVRSAGDEQFQSKFEKPYAALKFPFFMALGNHDQSGTAPGSGDRPDRGDFQVAYTRQSAKWMMPQRYYRFAAPFAQADDYQAQVRKPVIEFFVIDTNHLAPMLRPKAEEFLPGGTYDLVQKRWLRESVSTSLATWKVVVGHHPFISNGTHGSAGEFAGLGLSRGFELKKLFEQEVCGKVDWIFSGHEHALQWLKPHGACGSRTQFLVSGAAAKSGRKNDNSSNPEVWQEFGELGFFWIEATAQKMRILAYTVDSKGKPKLRHEGTVER